MGEMADYLNQQTNADFGVIYNRPVTRSLPRGPGKCPKCGWECVKKTGKYGVFYGCSNFPACNGRRVQG